jgi:hypothetical protein
MPYDPNDPVQQTLQAMAQQGQLPQNAPAHADLQPEGFVHTLMHNLVHNSVATQDSNVLVRAISGIEDVLNAPHGTVQAALGITPESQMEFSRAHPVVPQLSELLPMLSSLGMQSVVPRMIQGGPVYHGSPEMTNMAADLALDPTTYLGVGLFKNLGKGAAKVGAPKLIQGGLEAAAKGDAAYEAAATAISQTMLGLAQKLLSVPNNLLAKQFPDLVKLTEAAKMKTDMGQALQWLTQYRGLTPAQMEATVKTAGNAQPLLDELPTALKATVDPTHLEKVISLFPANATANDLGLVMQDYEKFARKDLGIGSLPPVIREYVAFNRWFKEQALGSINYLSQNLASGAAMGQMEGVGSAQTLSDAASHLGDIIHGNPFHIQGASDLARKTDLPIPYALHETADRTLNAIAPASTSPARDTIVGASLGALGAGPLGAVLGGAVGSQIAGIGARLRKSSQGIETVLRERGWEEGMSRSLVDSMADMERVIVDGLTKPGARGGPVQKIAKTSGRAYTYTPPPVHQNFIDILTKQVQDAGGQISSNDIRKQLLNSVRITPERTNEITRALDDILYNASQKGIDKSNAFNFDYQDLSAIERVMSEAFPFSIWTMKAVPFMFEKELQHPAIGNVYRAEREASYQDQQQQGLTGRFAGMLPMPGSNLFHAITGRSATLYNDPLRAFLPFAGTSASLARMQYEDPAQQGVMSTITDALDALGLSPSPVATMIAKDIGGMGDPSAPTRGILRSAAPIQGATALASRGVELATGQNPGWNVDLNEGQRKIETAVRLAVTKQEATDPVEAATERRIDEIALRDTGQPIGAKDAALAPYANARRTHTGPLWDKAQAEVELDRGIQALSGFISQGIQPQAILTSEEGQIRAAKQQTLLNPQIAHTLDTAAETTPTVMADQKTLDAVTQAVSTIRDRTGRETPALVVQKLATPTNENLSWIAKEIYKWDIEQQPLDQGYGPSGTPEARKIGNAVLGMSHAGEGLTGQEVATRVLTNQTSAQSTPGSRGAGHDATGAIQAALKIAPQDRATIKIQTPLLDEYLTWKASHPLLEVADFLAEKFGK